MTAFDTDSFDRAVNATPGISTGCSNSDWILSAKEHLCVPEAEEFIEIDEHWAAFGMSPHSSGAPCYHSLEIAWGFACPVVGATQEGQAAVFRQFLQTRPPGSLIFLSGIGSNSHLAAILQKAGSGAINWDPTPSNCLIAKLDRGVPKYLARRAKSFAKRLRSAERRITKRGFEFKMAEGEPGEIFSRILAVESRSWKSEAGESIFQQGSYLPFYLALLERAQRSGKLRVLFAQLEDQDAAYIFGGIYGDTYRGFQMSFADEYRPLSLGNVLQLKMMEAAVQDGVIKYDLGMWAPYKDAWADERLELSRCGLRV